MTESNELIKLKSALEEFEDNITKLEERINRMWVVAWIVAFFMFVFLWWRLS